MLSEGICPDIAVLVGGEEFRLHLAVVSSRSE